MKLERATKILSGMCVSSFPHGLELYDWNHKGIKTLMHNILLFNADDRPFEASAIERVLQSAPGFRDVRFNEPGGAAVEAEYIEPEFRTIVRLSGDYDTISLRGTSDAALRAALILQKNLGTPLRIVDTDYSFDLVLEGLSNVEELRAAMEKARTS